MEPSGHIGEKPLPESFNCTHCCSPVHRGVQGNKKQEIVKELRFSYPYVLPAIGARTSYLNGGLLKSETELHEPSAEFCFYCPCLQHAGLLVTSNALRCLCIQLPLHQLSPSWASSVLGSALQRPSQGCFSQVKSEKWHQICWGSV